MIDGRGKSYQKIRGMGALLMLTIGLGCFTPSARLSPIDMTSAAIVTDLLRVYAANNADSVLRRNGTPTRIIFDTLVLTKGGQPVPHEANVIAGVRAILRQNLEIGTRDDVVTCAGSSATDCSMPDGVVLLRYALSAFRNDTALLTRSASRYHSVVLRAPGPFSEDGWVREYVRSGRKWQYSRTLQLSLD